MIKNSKSYYLNSNDRISGSDSNFTIDLKIDPNIKYTHVSLCSATIPKSFYNIDETNNSFTLKEDSKEVLIVLTPGNYKLKTLFTQLQLKLNQLSPNGFNYIVSYPTSSSMVDDGKLTFTVSNNGFIQPSIILNNNDTHHILGFQENSINNFSNNTLKSVGVINLQKIGCLYICSDICNDNESNILGMVYHSSYADYSYINYQNNDIIATSKLLSHNKSNVYTFSLIDSDQNAVINTNLNHMILHIVLFELVYSNANN